MRLSALLLPYLRGPSSETQLPAESCTRVSRSNWRTTYASSAGDMVPFGLNDTRGGIADSAGATTDSAPGPRCLLRRYAGALRASTPHEIRVCPARSGGCHKDRACEDCYGGWCCREAHCACRAPC